MKELIEKFEEQFTFLHKIMKKYTTFSVPIEWEVTGTGTNWEEITKTISLRLNFIKRARFMASIYYQIFSIISLKQLIKLNVNLKWKSKARVTNCELQVQIHELWVKIHELRVQIRELRVQIPELWVQIHKLRVQIHELRY